MCISLCISTFYLMQEKDLPFIAFHIKNPAKSIFKRHDYPHGLILMLWCSYFQQRYIKIPNFSLFIKCCCKNWHWFQVHRSKFLKSYFQIKSLNWINNRNVCYHKVVVVFIQMWRDGDLKVEENQKKLPHQKSAEMFFFDLEPSLYVYF